MDYINLMNDPYGKYHDILSPWKSNSKDPATSFRNALTRRNREISESTCSQMQRYPQGQPVLPSSPPASNQSGSTATSADSSRTS